MSRRQAMVLERKGKKITVMTRSGEFLTLRAAHSGVLPGDTITLPTPFVSRMVFGRLVPALALSAVMVFLSFFGYQEYLMARPAVAYMSLDSYGSIELEVNDRNLVTSAIALDEPGVEILNSVDYKLRPIDIVMADLVKAQGAKGATNVVIALVPVDADQEIEHLENLVANEVAKEIWENPGDTPGTDTIPPAPEVSISMVTLDLDARDEAKKMGISAGRAASWALSKHHTPGNEGPSDPSDPTDPLFPENPEDPGEPNDYPDPEGTHEGKGDFFGIWETIRKELPAVNLDKVIDQEEPEKFLKDVTKKWLKELDDMLKSEEKEKDKEKDKGKDKDKNHKEDKEDKDDKNTKPGKGNTRRSSLWDALR